MPSDNNHQENGMDRRAALKQIGFGAVSTTQLARLTNQSTQTQQSDFVNLISIDPQNYPHIRVNFTVETEAGRQGAISSEAVTITEQVSGQPEREKSCGGFQFGGGSADIVFVFDDSGSMEEEIGTMKERVQSLTDEIEAAGIDARYGLVTFTDADRHLEVDTGFTDATTLKRRIEDLQATEGTRFPERSFSAIEQALDLSFRSDAHKVIVTITDVLSHYRDDKVTAYDSEYTIDEVATDLRERGISFFAVSWDYRGEVPFTDDSSGITYDETDIQNGSVRVLADNADGEWIDMEDADLSVILDTITQDVETTYQCSFDTSAPPEQQQSAGEVSVTVTDPNAGTASDSGGLSIPSEVKEAGEVRKANGDPATKSTIAAFRAGTNRQLSSTTIDAEGNYNLAIPIDATETPVDVQYYQILDTNLDTPRFERPLPAGQVAGPTDGSPDVYAIRQITAAETGGIISTELPDAYMLDVTVTDPNGEPIQNARVDVFHRNNGAMAGLFAFTQGNGRMKIPGGDDTGIEVQGNVRVAVRPPGAETPTQRRSLTVEDRTSITMTIER